MTRLRAGDIISFYDHREKKAIKVKVYKVSETHNTYTYPDGKMGCMTFEDYEREKR
jgi:hypothetical protein